MRTASPEPWIEWLSRKILWLAVGGLELLWLHIAKPLLKWFWGMVGRRTEMIVKWVLGASMLIMFVVFVAVWWHNDYQFAQTFEMLKMFFE